MGMFRELYCVEFSEEICEELVAHLSEIGVQVSGRGTWELTPKELDKVKELLEQYPEATYSVVER